MATRTIHTLAYKLLVDSSNFEKGMIASRYELSMAKREMRSLLTPAQKMEVSLENLGRLAKKDAKFQELYNRKLAQYQNHLKKTNAETSLLGRSSGLLKSKLLALGAAAAGAFTASAIISGIKQQVDEVDKLAKVSDKLGISTENLTRLQFAASKTSGLNDDQTSKGLEKMIRRVSEAAQGMGEARDVLKEIGLDAKKLAASTPDQAFLMIARSMDKVTDKHDRLRIATKLFDDEQAGIHTTLALTNKELRAQFRLSDSLGTTLAGIQADKMVAAKDAMSEFSKAWSGFTRQFTTEFLPSITGLLNKITPFVNTDAAGAMFERIFTGKSLAQSLADNIAIKAKRDAANARNNPDKTIGESSLAKKAVAERMAKDAAKLEQDRMTEKKRVMKEILFLTESVRTEEEKHRATIERINVLRGKGLSAQAADRLLRQNDDRLRGSLIDKIKSGLDTSPIKRTIATTGTSGPLESIAAGSSAAFAISNRTTVRRQVEIEIARKQVNLAEKSLIELQRIAGAQSQTVPEGGVDG